MLDLVFMDTTSLYFEGTGGQALGQHGYSKDHRPDLHQMILAVLLDGDGRPVCTEMWPGSTADTGSLIPVVDRLRRRFSIERVCIVADRGMISAETIAELEARGLLYILGVRERTDKLVRELVLNDPARPSSSCRTALTNPSLLSCSKPSHAPPAPCATASSCSSATMPGGTHRKTSQFPTASGSFTNQPTAASCNWPSTFGRSSMKCSPTNTSTQLTISMSSLARDATL
jgi:hypothetical protein